MLHQQVEHGPCLSTVKTKRTVTVCEVDEKVRAVVANIRRDGHLDATGITILRLRAKLVRLIESRNDLRVTVRRVLGVIVV